VLAGRANSLFIYALSDGPTRIRTCHHHMPGLTPHTPIVSLLFLLLALGLIAGVGCPLHLYFRWTIYRVSTRVSVTFPPQTWLPVWRLVHRHGIPSGHSTLPGTGLPSRRTTRTAHSFRLRSSRLVHCQRALPLQFHLRDVLPTTGRLATAGARTNGPHAAGVA